MPNKIIAVANQKGGVGKTTTTINLGAGIAAAEKTALLIDLDPQANLTAGLGIRLDSDDASIYDVLLADANPKELVRPTELQSLKLLPSSRHLAGAEVELTELPDREYRLKRQIGALAEDFDFVFIDCPPSLGLLTVNALVAADAVLVPLQCEFFALSGVTELLNSVERIRAAFNPGLEVEGIVFTMVDERTNLTSQVMADVREHFPGVVFRSIVPRNVRLAEAPSFGKPILLYDIRSKGAEAYLSLTKEVLGL